MSNKKMVIYLVLVLVGVLGLSVVFCVLVGKTEREREDMESKYTEFTSPFQVETTIEEVQSTEPETEESLQNEQASEIESTTQSVLDSMKEYDSVKQTEGTTELATYDYSLAYDAFPYYIELGYIEVEELNKYFSDELYSFLKYNDGEEGILKLEAIYVVSKALNLDANSFVRKDPTRFTTDGTQVLNYETPNGMLVIVINTEKLWAYAEIGEW